ncbi:MAG TPA: hypothetical protein VGI12_16820 [Vicinamibacterales bacterium]|jgi:hypothetical protein
MPADLGRIGDNPWVPQRLDIGNPIVADCSLSTAAAPRQEIEMNRRGFLRTGLLGGAAALLPRMGRPAAREVAIAVAPDDPIAASAPAAKAIEALERALRDTGIDVRRVTRIADAPTGVRCVAVAGHLHPEAAAAIQRLPRPLGDGAERLALFSSRAAGRDVLFACATDARGLSYAARELADRVAIAADPLAALAQPSPAVARPLNPVRSVMRQYTSRTLDDGWFHDREMWPAYLSMLAASRFNRLHLGFGLGYDTLQQVTDSYLLFIYPFLVDVPGYDVRVSGVEPAERERNLQALRYISEQTVAHGLTFQLGVWMHGYELIDSPQAGYRVEGLTPATHAAYCRDALTALLRACPAISAVALRIHGESGVKEGSYDFWKTVFDGVPRAGRAIEIDLHAKGIDQEMIDRALATGMPVNLSPKYWAEHLGLPYHQADIRALERPVEGHTGAGLMTLSEGSRSFTRYGYADLLREDRRYTVRFRVFSGSQRLLASADLAAAAAHARAFTFCGAAGTDLMEPLTCRGRRGTGIAGAARSGYADASLDTRWDWEKFALWYRTWGLACYDAATPASVALAPLAQGDPAAAVSLARASRILPLVTTAHLPSAACDAYWPEVYWNQPMGAERRPNPYGDTPAPKTFIHVSPLDPELFSSIAEHADDLANGRASAKHSPIQVATHLESLVAGIAPVTSGARMTPAARRLAVDVKIQAGLGRFFAAKLRAGVLYALHQQTGDRAAFDAALERYRAARAAWAELASAAQGVYAADLSASDRLSERGQWSDRLAAIDDDIARLAEAPPPAVAQPPRVAGAVAQAQATVMPAVVDGHHAPPDRFVPGRELPLALAVRGSAPREVACHYRHVNQAERFERFGMEADGGEWRGRIPAAYTDSPYPLQYYFTVLLAGGGAAVVPGLGPEWLGTPYFVVRRA